MEQPSTSAPPLLPVTKNYTGARLLAALTVGVVMGGLAGLTVVQLVGKQLAIYPVRTTRERLKSIRSSVEEYRKANSALPVSLSAFRVFGSAPLGLDEEGEIRDGWGRLILYTADSTNYVAYSLGRDGKPGGVGVDCDLSTQDTTSLPIRPTFGQLLDLTPSERVANAGFASGLLSSVLAFFVIRPKHFAQGQRSALLGSVILTSVVAGILALFIAALHSSGH